MPISGKNAVKKLKKSGWDMISQNGSHVKLRKNGVTTIIPVHGNHDLPKGTLKSIEKQTGEKLS